MIQIMQENLSTHGTVIFDGECPFCYAAMTYAKGKDTDGNLTFVAYQLANLNQVSPGLNNQMAEQTFYFIGQDGTRFQGARAVFEVLKRLPGLWGLFGAVMSFPLLSTLSEPFYRAFASNRRALSRKTKPTEDHATR